ncbi:MAG TPA: hypothetical protein VFU71_23680 [Burkholderiaceae bacterium]|nr:hypothetical protein [Burkholderiaceae bacterium]
MKRWFLMCVAAGALDAATAQQAPPGAASAPVTPYKRVQPLPPPEAPTVQKSKEATIPGDLRPEREPVPQIRIPFGKRQVAPSTGSGIDDSVARCRAKRTSEERERCEAGLDSI